MYTSDLLPSRGGLQVAALCRDQMHAILAEELAVAAAAYREAHQQEDQEAEFRAWEEALKRSFERADALGALESGGTIMGSTAVVALLVRDFILVANCGDSRAVLCRAGGAIPLSQDHKVIELAARH
jgi:protein phosphatase 2C